ncbi:MAG TPA: hypothetical protein PK674_00270 [Candidatus Absconditabacterales bacterium]|nr:hypothetical protein [Candidatus Absconditabacterales bacterium]HOQ78796.1 hypothetical protein [Candidatus Absconditabacterales bacterium]HPK27611.1 hypothetical protein [Candidatus Absconditabacterales bacterium]
MGDTSGRKIKRFLVGLNWKKKKSRQKYKKAIERYILVLKKESIGGKTKRTKDTKQRALARLKKYGITMNQVKEALDRKGLNDLSSKIVA